MYNYEQQPLEATMKYKVFIDGRNGATGLKIESRLAAHPNVKLLAIPNEMRKIAAIKKALINEADVIFLCLPDAAAREAVLLLDNTTTRIIDASTAHRTDTAWAYGLPELSEQYKEKIANARFVSVPGCYATCFALCVYPLVADGVIGRDYPVTASGVSGYSGAGREAIGKYEDANRKEYLSASLYYSLGLKHKHVPEMQLHAGLDFAPAFNPVICDFRQGMAVAVPILGRLMKKRLPIKEIHALLAAHYAGQQFVRVMPLEPGAGLDDGYLNPMACNGTNYVDLFVLGNDEQVCVMARLDNLGKGSSGAAVQCMNIMMGLDEGIGL
jgi:N-acetyl-gamma-glutamyl-phosphate reductase